VQLNGDSSGRACEVPQRRFGMRARSHGGGCNNGDIGRDDDYGCREGDYGGSD
jgi:hypothetical protein